MMPDYERTYKGYLISHYAGRCWSVTKSVPGKFFEKVEYLATCGTERDCIDYINSII